jgi:DNA gyrase inhibitor GyrI
LLNQLDVEKKELDIMLVAYIRYIPEKGERPDFEVISEYFDRVKEWAESRGIDTMEQRAIGILIPDRDGLVCYDCVIVLPESKYHETGINVKTLSGGLYLVLTMEKKQEIIGTSISKLHQEYTPSNQLELDIGRPILEIYTDATMEYSVPVKN